MSKHADGSGFVHRSAREEFIEFTNKELQRLNNADGEFDEALYKKAVELVLEKLKER